MKEMKEMEEMEETEETEENITEDGGVKKKVIKKGEGLKCPEKESIVVFYYVGKFLNGIVFDSLTSREDPIKVWLGKGMAIEGIEKAVLKMKKGEISLITCTSEYAYGEYGSPPIVPPNSTLQFELELIEWIDSNIDPDLNDSDA